MRGWKLNTLKEYVERVFEERERRYLDKFAAKEELAKIVESASSRAVSAAASGVAELRERVAESVPRAEWTLQYKALLEKVDELKTEISTMRSGQKEVAGTRAGMDKVVAYIVGSMGFVTGVVLIILRLIGE
jgi:hypothetical protein